MLIRDYRIIPPETLLEKLTKTRLIGHGQAAVYENAVLTFEQYVDPGILIPAQRYVLKKNSQVIEDLYSAFWQQYSINIFSMIGGILFWKDTDGGYEEGIPITPPIIEVSTSAAGKEILLISDGMHRVYTAMKLRSTISIILVKNIPPQYPYYAYPLEGGWDDVVELTELPDGFRKKNYRNISYKDLFRNYNEVLPGIQKRR